MPCFIKRNSFFRVMLKHLQQMCLIAFSYLNCLTVLLLAYLMHTVYQTRLSIVKIFHTQLKMYLQWSRAQLMTSSALCNLGQVIHEPLEYISSIQVTVIIHIDIHDTLSIWKSHENVWLTTGNLRPREQQVTS